MSLSDKRHRNAYEDFDDLDWLYDEKDVRDAVKELQNVIYDYHNDLSGREQTILLNKIKKIFGEELTK